jgi:hypothetical protein
MTGKPYYYASDNSRKYDLSAATVPAEHRRMMQLRGGIFHAYTTQVYEDKDTVDVSVSDFLEKFPTWEEVHEHDPECDYWTEKEHNEFKDALLWLNANNGIEYRVQWSY